MYPYGCRSCNGRFRAEFTPSYCPYCGKRSGAAGGGTDGQKS